MGTSESLVPVVASAGRTYTPMVGRGGNSLLMKVDGRNRPSGRLHDSILGVTEATERKLAPLRFGSYHVGSDFLPRMLPVLPVVQ